jgi:hypothetical protein
MDPYSGKTYSQGDVQSLPTEVRDRLVTVEGDQQQVAHLSRAVAHYAAVTGQDKARRRAANKAARKARRASR